MADPVVPAHQPLYAGFDLGTTNSAAAAFDGTQLIIIRNAEGSNLTPSVVRIDDQGRVTVGSRAQRFLERDPENTRAEFKRLMGTRSEFTFPGAKVTRRPEELAAEVLRSLRADMQDQLGVAPVRAVISVPALFELPQSKATGEAARLAGFESVELLQEPIASALAAGWDADEEPGAWLVYDLGGGTFDVSLLETRDGLLRIIGHDGDNFLGGRDFDMAIVDWAITRLGEDGIDISRSDPDHASAVRALKRAAEEAKIALSRASETDIFLSSLRVGDREVSVELNLDRQTLEALCTPAIDRSLMVCRRLLEENGIDAAGAALARVVLVGGPTVMPLLRRRVEDQLQTAIAEGCDPMTLVAQGTALYAATAGVDGRDEPRRVPSSAHRLWLQYPVVSSDLTPHVVGKLVEAAGGPPPATIALVRTDGQWQSPPAPITDEGFVTMADLVPRRPNIFRIVAADADGNPVTVDPQTITIVQGLTITDPPLSRSVGVALANDSVCVYFERGAPLPARRTFTHHTVESVARGAPGSLLKIPLVQGEFEQAHLCRLVGTLEVGGAELKDSVPVGTPVQVTLELDRGGALSARALIESLGQTFDKVARLLVPDADPETLESALDGIITRIAELRASALRNGRTQVIEKLEHAAAELDSAERDIVAARGGDDDAGQKARRTLLELDALLADLELEKRWPELEAAARDDLGAATMWVSQYGTESEARLLDEVYAAVERARADRNVGELQRQLRLARRLGSAAMHRDPSAWEWMFESAASEVDRATDLPAATRLVSEGRAALARGDNRALQRITEKLWRLLPSDAKTRRLSFDSGLR